MTYKSHVILHSLYAGAYSVPGTVPDASDAVVKNANEINLIPKEGMICFSELEVYQRIRQAIIIEYSFLTEQVLGICRCLFLWLPAGQGQSSYILHMAT